MTGSRISIELTQQQLQELARAALNRDRAVPLDVRDLVLATSEGRALLGELHAPRCSQLSQPLLRGLVILNYFQTTARDHRVEDIAEEFGMTKSSTSRYPRTLVAPGVLEHEPKTGCYRIARTSSRRSTPMTTACDQHSQQRGLARWNPRRCLSHRPSTGRRRFLSLGAGQNFCRGSAQANASISESLDFLDFIRVVCRCIVLRVVLLDFA